VWDAEGEKGIAKELKLKADGSISPDAIPEDFTETNEKNQDKTVYDRDSFIKALKAADEAGNGDGKVDRSEWRAAKHKGWRNIWLWPAAAALVTCIVFWFGFRETKDDEIAEAMADDAGLGAGEGPEPQVG